MSRTYLIVGFVLALANISNERSALATEPDPIGRAAELMSQAEEAATSGRLQDAMNALHTAWSIAPSFKIACNIGRLEFRERNMRATAEFLSICAENTPKIRTPDEQARDARTANALSIALQHVAALSIDVSEPGADIRIDDKPVGRSPLPRAVFVEPGPHRVTAKLSGYEPATVEVNGGVGLSTPLRISLRSIAPARPVAAPSCPVCAPDVKPLVPLASAPEPQKSGFPVLPLALGGGAAVALGSGALLSALEGSAASAVQQQSRRSQVNDGLCAQPPCGADDAIAKRDAFHGLAIASFTTAAALTAGAVVVAALSPKRARKPAAGASSHSHSHSTLRGVTVVEW